MDSFELNKIAGAVLFALLILFGTRTASDIIFAAPAPEKPGYEVEVAEDGAPAPKAEEAKEEISLAALLAEGDAGKGESVAKKCAACHTFDDGGKNKIGPNLHGIVGAALAAVDGFKYSDALKSKGGDWDYEALDGFIAKPKEWAPGTKMAFAGIRSAKQRADLILYLRSLGGNPPPLPEAAPAAAEQPAAAEAPAAAEQPATTQ